MVNQINLAKLKDNILKNQKIILYAVIALCILAADFYFILKPVFGDLIRILPEVSAKSSRVKIMDTDVSNISKYEQQIETLRKKLSGYKRKFSTKEEISPLLKNLSDTANACGVKIVAINPIESPRQSSSKKSSNAYRKFPIYLSAISGYHQFGLFLNKLESSTTFMRIMDLKIAGDVSGINNHKFDVTVVTYILSAPEEKREEGVAEKKKSTKRRKKR